MIMKVDCLAYRCQMNEILDQMFYHIENNGIKHIILRIWWCTWERDLWHIVVNWIFTSLIVFMCFFIIIKYIFYIYHFVLNNKNNPIDCNWIVREKEKKRNHLKFIQIRVDYHIFFCISFNQLINDIWLHEKRFIAKNYRYCCCCCWNFFFQL